MADNVKNKEITKNCYSLFEKNDSTFIKIFHKRERIFFGKNLNVFYYSKVHVHVISKTKPEPFPLFYILKIFCGTIGYPKHMFSSFWKTIIGSKPWN